MSKKETASSSTTQTTTDQSIEDNRVVASDDGIGVGKVEIVSGGDLTYQQQFSPDVAKAFAGMLELSRGSVSQAISSVEQTTDDFMKSVSEIKTGTTSLNKILPYTLVIIGGLVLIALIGRKK